MEAHAAATEQLSQNPDPQPTPPKESKAETFDRLAIPRVEKALTALRRIGNLGNRSIYEYQPEDVEAISRALQHALDEAMDRFRDRSTKTSFNLPGR